MGFAGTVLLSVVGALLLAEPASATTKIVDVGPGGRLVFLDEEGGTDTTTVNVGDTVQWMWQSSGHSTTRSQSSESWDSDVQDFPFSFSHQFMTAGTFPYHCTPHQFLGMTGMVVVLGSGSSTTTTTMPPPPTCTDTEALARVRAAVAAQCECTGAPSHRSYVKCAVGVAKRAVNDRTLPRPCQTEVRRCAAQSTCGRPAAVTCCRTSAHGAQTCAIRPRATACRSPKRGTACVGDLPSCCDACGGATCPAPVTTSTSSTSTMRATTTTVPSASSLCDATALCPGGICPVGMPTRCPDGTSALWVGTATSPSGSVDIVLAICASDGSVSGTFFCRLWLASAA
jgi:plastocyanin